MKATIKLELRKDFVTKDGRQMLCLRYTAHRRSTLISLNISIPPKYWNSKTQTISTRDPHCQFYNKVIHEVYHKADSILMDYFFNPLPLPDFLNKLKDKHLGNTDFYVFIENEIELLKASRAEGTISNYNKLINTMKKWKPTLTFDDITLEYIQRYHNHELECGNILSTIYKKHANFKFLIGLAVDKEKISKSPYDKFEIKKSIKSQNNDVLTEEEIKLLQKTYEEGNYTAGKQEVLREFLFSCYTSLSYAEFDTLTYSDIKPIRLSNGMSYHLITNERTKTSVTYKIPIVSETVMNLLGSGESVQKIFSPLTNQPTNRYLKEIMKDMKINKTMTFHRARHTWRTIAARRGIRDTIAERIMGHAEGNDIKDIYTHLHDEDIVAEVAEKWVV